MSKDASASKAKLLYVDDERPNLVAFRALLCDTYDVLIAENADQAFRFLASHDIPLIVSDQRMPGMSGTELLQKVAAQYPDTARMILTGYADIEAVIDAINRGRIYYYFKKPWNEWEVRLTLANALESVVMRRQLIDSERRFRLTFEQAGLGIAHLDLQGLILRANVQFQEFLGVTESELVGKPLETWFTGFDPEELIRVVDGQGGKVVREASLPTPHGERWSRLTSSVSSNGKGDPAYLIVLVDDLTERRQSEQRYRQLSEDNEQRVKQTVAELREKDKMLVIQGRQAVMGEMISIIAHQWRQPLNLLALLAQELQITCRAECSQDFIDANIGKTLEIIWHMSKTIDDFRYFFRPNKEKVRFGVLEVVQKTLSLLEGSLAAQKIRTRIDATGDPYIIGYPNEFSQVLINLLINARDAFETRNIAEPVITIRCYGQEQKTIVTVLDNAGGISEQSIERIFEPYFSTKGPEHGTGLGLFMCKTIIEKHMNGSITVRNIDDGVEFTIQVCHSSSELEGQAGEGSQR